MSAYISSLGPQIERFLAHKRGLGFIYCREERFLAEFDRVAADLDEGLLTESLVRTYLSRFAVPGRPNRLTLMRQLGRFLIPEEPCTFVPTTAFLGVRRRHPVIRVLSRQEARRFLQACDTLPVTASVVHRVVHGTMLQLLLLTGLRCGEAIALHNHDADLDQRVLVVRHGKAGKTRFVPIAADLADRLATYRKRMAAEGASGHPGDPFFPGANRRRPTSRKSLYKAFRMALDVAGIPHRGRGEGPRLHDLRHSFAVLRLLGWYEANADLGAKLPLLATYLGHVGLGTSQIYLHMTRDLVGEVLRREMHRFGDLITEQPR